MLARACCAPAPAELTGDPLLGPRYRSRPAYDGSASQMPQFVPVLRVADEPLFARSTQDVLEGGLRMALAPGLLGGLQVAYEPGRKSGEAPFLASHCLPDLARGASLGAHIEWEHRFGRVPIAVLARLRQHADLARGLQIDLRANVGLLRWGALAAGAYAEEIWSSAKSSDAFYCITPEQSRTVGLPAFRPAAGPLSAVAGLGWRCDLGPDWVVAASLEWRRLQAAVATSPPVQQRANRYDVLGVAYRF